MRDTRRDGSPILEAAVEAHLVKKMRQIGGRAFKFPPVVKGAPDRIVVFPYGRIYFVELKRKGKKPEPAQELWHARMLGIGHVVHVIDSRELVDNFITWALDQEGASDDAIRRVSEERDAVLRRYQEEV